MLCPPLLAAWGRDTAGGAALLTACVEAAAVYLLRWRGEPHSRAPHARSSPRSLVSAAAPLMPSLPATRRLVELPASTLPGRAQRLLYEALCRAALAAADDARAAAVGELCATLRARLVAATDGCAGANAQLVPGAARERGARHL